MRVESLSRVVFSVLSRVGAELVEGSSVCIIGLVCSGHQVTQKATSISSVIQLFMGHVAFVGLLNIDNLMNLNQCA